MTFRTIVRDGMININTHGELPDGTPVEALPIQQSPPRRGSAQRASAKKAAPKRPSKKTGKPDANPLLSLAGIWKSRPEWKGKSTLEIHRELRAKAMGGRSRG